jgi:hypothetical protein
VHTCPPGARWAFDTAGLKGEIRACVGCGVLQALSLKLHDAAAVGDLTKLRKLVSDGAMLEYKASDGMRPIHRACHAGQVEAIKLLVELGADKEAKTFDGGSPLHCAADHGHVDAVNAPPIPETALAANELKGVATMSEPKELITRGMGSRENRPRPLCRHLRLKLHLSLLRAKVALLQGGMPSTLGGACGSACRTADCERVAADELERPRCLA